MYGVSVREIVDNITDIYYNSIGVLCNDGKPEFYIRAAEYSFNTVHRIPETDPRGKTV